MKIVLIGGTGLIGSKTAARFWQVETMLGQLIGLQLGAEIPLMH